MDCDMPNEAMALSEKFAKTIPFLLDGEVIANVEDANETLTFSCGEKSVKFRSSMRAGSLILCDWETSQEMQIPQFDLTQSMRIAKHVGMRLGIPLAKVN